MTSVLVSGRPLWIPHASIESLKDVRSWERVGGDILTPRPVEELNWASAGISVIDRATDYDCDPETIHFHRKTAKRTLGGIGYDMSQATRLAFEQGLIVPTHETVEPDAVSTESQQYAEWVSRGYSQSKVAEMTKMHVKIGVVALTKKALGEFGANDRPHMVRIAFQSDMLTPDN